MVERNVCRNIERKSRFTDRRTSGYKHHFTGLQAVRFRIESRKIGIYRIFRHVARLHVLYVFYCGGNRVVNLFESGFARLLGYRIHEFFGVCQSVFAVFALIAEFRNFVACGYDFSRESVTLYDLCVILAVCRRHDSFCKVAEIRDGTYLVKLSFDFQRVAYGHHVYRLAFRLKLLHHGKNHAILRKIKVFGTQKRNDEIRRLAVDENRA